MFSDDVFLGRDFVVVRIAARWRVKGHLRTGMYLAGWRRMYNPSCPANEWFVLSPRRTAAGAQADVGLEREVSDDANRKDAVSGVWDWYFGSGLRPRAVDAQQRADDRVYGHESLRAFSRRAAQGSGRPSGKGEGAGD